jgi:hypothetical protein
MTAAKGQYALRILGPINKWVNFHLKKMTTCDLYYDGNLNAAFSTMHSFFSHITAWFQFWTAPVVFLKYAISHHEAITASITVLAIVTLRPVCTRRIVATLPLCRAAW